MHSFYVIQNLCATCERSRDLAKYEASPVYMAGVTSPKSTEKEV